MGQSFTKDPRRIFSQGGMDLSTEARITTLENNEVKILYFAELSSGTTGTITKPTNSTILLDSLASGVDALVCTIVNGQPTYIPPETAGGAVITVSSFDTSGNWTITGTASAYPVALIYILKIKAKDYSNLTIANILDAEDTAVNAPDTEILFGTGQSYSSSSNATFNSSTKLLTLTNSTANSKALEVSAGTSFINAGESTQFAGLGVLHFSSSRTNTNWVLRSDGSAQTQVNSPGVTGRTDLSVNGNAKVLVFASENRIVNITHIGSATAAVAPTAILHLAAGTATASTAPLKFTTGTNLTAAEAGVMEYNNTFHLTNSDATRRHIALAPNTTKVTAGAPYANSGYVVLNIGGTDFNVMVTG